MKKESLIEKIYIQALEEADIGVLAFSKDVKLTFYNQWVRSMLDECQVIQLPCLIHTLPFRFTDQQGKVIMGDIQDFIMRTYKDKEARQIDCFLQNNEDNLPVSLSIEKGMYVDDTVTVSIMQRAGKPNRQTVKNSQRLDKLIESNKDLSRINEQLENFVYRVSHDLKSPLASITGLINLAEMEDHIPPQVKGYLDMMRNQTAKLQSFIQELIIFSKNSSMAIKADTIDFQKLVDNLIEQNAFHHDDIDFRIEVSQERSFKSDEGRIRVALSNLLSNSVKYRDKAKALNFISISVIADSKKACITIHDNGMGIEQQYLSRIFDMFFRATDSQEGSGLGLYITKEAIKRIKGKITTTSEIKKSTTVTIVLPSLERNK